jgi:hypothetical protein
MKRLALTQTALNLVAKTPEGRKLLRDKREEAEQKIETESAKFQALIDEAQGLVDRIRIALGEVAA